MGTYMLSSYIIHIHRREGETKKRKGFFRKITRQKEKRGGGERIRKHLKTQIRILFENKKHWDSEILS